MLSRVRGAACLVLPLLVAAEGDVDVGRLFLVLAAMLVVAKLLGELAERVGQPAVLGELLAGVLLGPSCSAIVPTVGPAASVVHVLAELGVLLLLFEIGLETDLREMFRVGPASLSVAAVGVAAPFALGLLYWVYLPHASLIATGDRLTQGIFIGATLTATSVGITARVLSDLGRMSTQEARIIIGAAVIDDVLGLVILSVVSGMAAGASVSVLGIARTLMVAVGFLVVAVIAGRFLLPRLFDYIVRMRARYVLLVFAFAFALGLAATAALAGSAMIIGAFAAGLDTVRHQPVRHHRARGEAHRVHLRADLLRQHRGVGGPRPPRSDQSSRTRHPRDRGRPHRARHSGQDRRRLGRSLDAVPAARRRCRHGSTW